MEQQTRKVAAVTGGSRGVGAATALVLADHGYDVALIYRNKVARASEVAAAVEARGARALSRACDLTHADQVAELFAALREWGGRLDVLVLCASGGMERELAEQDPEYPLRINRDAQVALVEAARPLLRPGGAVVFVTSHWAHLHGQVDHGPVYAPVAAVYDPIARSKLLGEHALRARQELLAERGVRLVVVTGDLVEGTIMFKLFARMFPAFIRERRALLGRLPTVVDMACAIVDAATDPALANGATVVVGGALASAGGQLA